MKKLLLFAVPLLFSGPVMAVQPEYEDDTFVSLTRAPEKLDQLPTNVQIITQEEIQKSGANSVADLLDYATSVDVGRTGSEGSASFVRIRGVPSANQVQVLMDDQPIGGTSIQNINLTLLPIDNIERIEIVRGGASVLYGANSVGGIVRIITKKNRQPWTAGYSLETGSFDTTIQRANVGATSGSFGVAVRGSKTNSDGFQDNSDADNSTAGGTLSWFKKNGTHFDLSVDHTNLNIGVPSDTPVPISDWDGEKEKEARAPYQRAKSSLTLGRLSGSVPFSFVKLDTSFYGSRELYEIREKPNLDPYGQHDNRIAGNDTHLTFINGGVIGASYERDARYSLGQHPHHTINTGLYAQAPLRGNITTIIPAVRYDHNDAFGSQINPRLSVVNKITDQWRATGNIARSHRNPTLVDLYDDFVDPSYPEYGFFGNPNLRPEHSWSYDVGTDYVFKDGTRIAVTGFRNEITDRIVAVDSDGINGVDTVENVAQAEIEGVETEIKTVTGLMTHSINYTFQEGRGTSATSTEFVPLAMLPRHTINYVSDLEPIQKFHIINEVKYVSNQFQLPDRKGVELPCYALWNAQIRNTWGPLTIFARVENITNRRYAEAVTYDKGSPMPTRAYYGGASVQF